jgi:hypothetical protein
MADVRSLLRQERATRQQSSRPPPPSARPAVVPSSKKRKAADDSTDERKRTRTEIEKGVPAGFFDTGTPELDNDAPSPPAGPNAADQDETAAEGLPNDTAFSPPAPPQPLDDDTARELDAFLQEMDQEPQPQYPIRSYASGAVIEAAPMTAAELAAQAREEQSAQRGRREEELEADKDEAARQMEDEFDEMEGLEERARKLREQREVLRIARAPSKTQVAVPITQPVANEEDESDSDDDEDWDGWRFRPA